MSGSSSGPTGGGPTSPGADKHNSHSTPGDTPKVQKINKAPNPYRGFTDISADARHHAHQARMAARLSDNPGMEATQAVLQEHAHYRQKQIPTDTPRPKHPDAPARAAESKPDDKPGREMTDAVRSRAGAEARAYQQMADKEQGQKPAHTPTQSRGHSVT